MREKGVVVMKKSPLSPTACAVLVEYGLDYSILRNCMLVHYDSGETILNQGTPVESLLVLLNGKAKVGMLAANGKDLTLCYYMDSGILGDVEFVQADQTASATSVAVFQTDCISIPLNLNRDYLAHSVMFMNHVAKGLSTKLLNSSYYHMTSVLYTGEERLCAYILMAEHNGVFSEILTDVSKSVGVSYRHLFRMLNTLCERGVLRKNKFGFVILDQKYLTEKSTHMRINRFYGSPLMP